MPVRFTITFLGRVQGVGFRATTHGLAARFAVAGFVRNQSDGSVLCVAEGEPAELNRFLHAIRQDLQGHVREAIVQESPATGEFDGFRILT